MNQPAAIAPAMHPLSGRERIFLLLFCMWFLLPVLVWLCGEVFFDGTALIMHPPLNLYFSTAILWAGISVIFWRILPPDRKHKLIESQKQRLLGSVVLIAGYLLFLLPYLARRIVEIAAFVGANNPISEAPLLIAYSTGRQTWNYALVGTILGQNGRDVSIKVDTDLKLRYNHVSTHHKDCIPVPVQRGRWGVERIVGPGMFDSGMTERRIIENCQNGISH